MHDGEDVGGWDTVLRREEYETLYARQQASMDMPDFANIIVPKEESKIDTVKASIHITPKVEDKPTGPDWATILAPVTVGISVNHKKFGDGKITWMGNLDRLEQDRRLFRR